MVWKWKLRSKIGRMQRLRWTDVSHAVDTIFRNNPDCKDRTLKKGNKSDNKNRTDDHTGIQASSKDRTQNNKSLQQGSNPHVRRSLTIDQKVSRWAWASIGAIIVFLLCENFPGGYARNFRLETIFLDFFFLFCPHFGWYKVGFGTKVKILG